MTRRTKKPRKRDRCLYCNKVFGRDEVRVSVAEEGGWSHEKCMRVVRKILGMSGG
jgi:hypothetical protein